MTPGEKAESLRKPGKRKKSIKRPTGVAEASIQGAVEAYLQLMGIRYVHVPDSIYRLCSPLVSIRLGSYNLSWGVKNDIRDSLKGMPDIIAFKPIPGKLGNNTLALELKKLNAKTRKIQENWHRGLNVHVRDTIEAAIKLINEWMDE